MNEQKTLTVDHLRAWVRYCEEQGDETVVGTTMKTVRCLGARTLQYIYHTQLVTVGCFNGCAWVDGETIVLDEDVTSILTTFDKSQGIDDEDGDYVEAPVTVAMLRQSLVWEMLFPEEERV